MNHIGNILVYKIDIVMIGLLLSATKVGYYSIFLFLTVVIEIPLNAVERISSPMISAAFERNDLEEISNIYKKTSVNLVIIGIVLFALLWMNMPTFFAVMTNGEDLLIYKTVFLFLALAKIFDMVTSVNFHIIAYSKYFRMNTLFILVLAVLNIVLNYWLIGELDIIGAAISTAISMFVFNVLKTIFILIKYKMHPFRWEYILLTLFLAVAVFSPLFFPVIFDSILFSLISSGIFCIVFAVTVYKLKLSLEINKMIDKYWLKVFN